MSNVSCADIQITFPTEKEALRLSRRLLKEGLVACVHIQAPGTSLYQWQGTSCEEAEVLVHYKTCIDRFEQLRVRVLDLHSYECPAISLSVIDQGHEEYLKWIFEQTRPQ